MRDAARIAQLEAQVAQLTAAHGLLATLMVEMGLTAEATIASVQRRLHVGVADAMRLLAVREAIASAALSASPSDDGGDS